MGRAFVGHVGGDDFFVGLEDWPRDKVARHMRDLRADFAHQVESLYSPEHRRQGFIPAEDRTGRMQTYSLLTCSIAVMHIPKGVVIDNLDMLSNHIARLKQHAKTQADGIAIASIGTPVTDVGAGASLTDRPLLRSTA